MKKSVYHQSYLTPAAAARRIGVRGVTVRRWCIQGVLRAWRTPTGRLHVDPAGVEKLVRNARKSGVRIL